MLPFGLLVALTTFSSVNGHGMLANDQGPLSVQCCEVLSHAGGGVNSTTLDSLPCHQCVQYYGNSLTVVEGEEWIRVRYDKVHVMFFTEYKTWMLFIFKQKTNKLFLLLFRFADL